MTPHKAISIETLHKQIRNKEICFAGNRQLKIYGTLHCKSGKRMKPANRVFFQSAEEAIAFGFRPCGHCLLNEYKTWKNGSVQSR